MIRSFLETWVGIFAGVLIYSLIFGAASLSDMAVWGRAAAIGLVSATLLMAIKYLRSK